MFVNLLLLVTDGGGDDDAPFLALLGPSGVQERRGANYIGHLLR